LGQVSGQSVPVCGAFVDYSSYDPFSPKSSGLWTHITIGPKNEVRPLNYVICARSEVCRSLENKNLGCFSEGKACGVNQTQLLNLSVITLALRAQISFRN